VPLCDVETATRYGDRLLSQDVIKKSTGDELPDFYNIVLERPRNDSSGFDVLFIDAASKVHL
jgi:hypothetical protein